MAWIDLPGREDNPELERLTRRYRRDGRPTPPVVAVMKQSPRSLRAVLAMNYTLSFGASTLGHRREELIAASISALNDCFY